MKRTRRSERIEREARERLPDGLSELPDCVLLHIMKFMNAKDVAQTCVLSKRWKDLWKRLTNLTLNCSNFSRLPFFSQFVSSVLSCRDDSISLQYLNLRRKGCIEPKLLNGIMTYAASHDVQQMIISVGLSLKKDFELPSCVFYCRSLTFLELSFSIWYGPANEIKLPKSLELPALKILLMENVTFATSDNGCVEPFSTCHMLNTLVIEDCYIKSDTEALCIFNSKLFNLTIIRDRHRGKPYEIKLSTPNLTILTLEGDPLNKLTSTCNITCLEQVHFFVNYYRDFRNNGLVLINWLQVLVNVKKMTLSWTAFEILNDLLSCDSIRTQLPCFVRLKSLRLVMKPFRVSDEEASKMVEYLLQNSPLTVADIIIY